MDKNNLRATQFPVTANLIYFNHAAAGPLSRDAAEAMERHAQDQMEFGALHWRDWYAEYDRFRTAAARLIGAAPSEISVLKNTSEGLSFVAAGFRWREGDNVITTDLEFPSNALPWRALEHRGVECRVVRSRAGTYSVSDVEALMDGRTRILSVSSAAFHNGFAPDLESLGELCEAKGVLFCVDAIQTLGAIRLDVKRAKISFLAADGHKWMLGPEGAAIFFCDERVRDLLEVLEHGWLNVDRRGRFLDCPLNLLDDGRRFEAGSLNTNGIFGLRASLDLIEQCGFEEVEQEVLRLATLLADGLESAGFRLGSPRPIRSGIVAVYPPGVDSVPGQERNALTAGMLHRRLEEEGVVCAPREGMLRFSPHFYNDDGEVERVIALLAGCRS
ncbi:MAG TPA: aminotransferase class V-fold PLP-dependent enzyme [Thermoanaerobaculia bacterium]|nr:aminotransferase class V-fold PLP-dependent enzyme [Thermoanaerobaculia bacterium]